MLRWKKFESRRYAQTNAIEEIVTSDVAPNVDEAVKTVAAQPVCAAEVDKVIRKSVYTSMGIGIVPLPFFNISAVTASSLVMVRRLSMMYDVEFKEGIAKKIIAAVVGSGVGVLASKPIKAIVGAVPLVGLPLAVATKPALNGMTTYALGRMFITHFERGGSFVGANVSEMKADFSDACKKSREWLGNTIKGKEKTMVEGA